MGLAGLDLDGLRGSVEDVSVRSLRLPRRDGLARFEILDTDFALAVCTVDSIVRPDDSAASIRHLELGAANRLIVAALHILPNHQSGQRFVVEGEDVGLAVPHRQGLGISVERVASGGPHFAGRNDRTGGNVVQDDFAVFVGGVLAAANGRAGPVRNDKRDAGDGRRGPLDILADSDRLNRVVEEGQRLDAAALDGDGFFGVVSSA